jgi:hypothetical protein
MKKLLYILGSSLLKKVLLTPPGSAYGSHSQAFPKFNIPYLSDLARKYLITASLGLVFCLFFVAGASISLFSAAQSFDLFGIFVPGAVFYTGVGMTVVSIIGAVSCYYSIRNTKILKEQIYVIEEEKADLRTPLDYLGLAQPFVHGLINGWKKESDRISYAKAQDELFPADEDLERADRAKVAEFRAS